MTLERSEEASASLISDLRSDKGMDWIPRDGMWLSYLKIDAAAADLDHDLAIDPTGLGIPSEVAAGLVLPDQVVDDVEDTPLWAWALAALLVAAAVAFGNKVVSTR
jgi:hypothetical protein